MKEEGDGKMSEIARTKSGRKVLKKKGTRGEWLDSKVFCFDIETWGLDASRFACGMIKNLTGDFSERFHEKEAMRDCINNLPSGSILYAHNAEYDVAGLFNLEEFLDMDKVYPTRLIAATYKNKNGEISLRDSFSLFPMSLSKLGDSLGFEKGKTPQKFIKAKVSKITWYDWKYLERDVDILVTAISELSYLFSTWIGENPADKGITSPLPLTMASLAYTVFSESFWPEQWCSKKQKKKGKSSAKFCPKGCKHLRSKYTTESLCPVCNTPTEIKYIFNGGKLHYMENFDVIGREAYAGGRTQVLGNPTENYSDVLCFDANSLYPSVMLSNPYPSPVKHWREPPSRLKLHRLISKSERLVIAKLTLNGENSSSQFLPAIDEDGRRNYSENLFYGHLCQPEIVAALERGWVIESVEELYSFKSEFIFKDFVEFFYNLRLEYLKKGDPREIMVKGILNSLYGKFGQKDYKKRVENIEKIDNLTQHTEWEDIYEIKNWNNHQGVYLLEKNPSQICENAFSPIAAFVTSYGRVKLLEAIEATDAIYCDTDSIFTQKSFEEISKILAIGSELGEWKQEGDLIPNFVAWEPKVYQMLDENLDIIKVKHKGANMSDGNLRKTQKARMMNKYRSAKNRASVDEKLGWGKFRIVDKKSKRFHPDKN